MFDNVSLVELKAMRAALAAKVQERAGVRAGDPRWEENQRDLATLRALNARIKAGNITVAARANADATVRRSAGLAEHGANVARTLVAKERAVAPPPPGQRHESPESFLLWQAIKARGTVQRLDSPEPHMVALRDALDAFIAAQRAYLAGRGAANTTGGDVEAWRETWNEDHHHRDDLACPACNTDSSTGCIA